MGPCTGDPHLGGASWLLGLTLLLLSEWPGLPGREDPREGREAGAAGLSGVSGEEQRKQPCDMEHTRCVWFPAPGAAE